MSESLTIIVGVRAKPGQEARLLQELERLPAPTRAAACGRGAKWGDESGARRVGHPRFLTIPNIATVAFSQRWAPSSWMKNGEPGQPALCPSVTSPRSCIKKEQLAEAAFEQYFVAFSLESTTVVPYATPPRSSLAPGSRFG